jgi:hypothetical protein
MTSIQTDSSSAVAGVKAPIVRRKNAGPFVAPHGDRLDAVRQVWNPFAAGGV